MNARHEPSRRMTPDAPLRVCFVCNTAWAIHTYRPGVLRELLAHGVDVIVIAPRDRTFAALEVLGCRCIDLPVASKSTNPLNDLRTFAALLRHYLVLRPDVVFHYTIKPNIYGSLAAWIARVKSVAVTTGLGYVFIQKSRAASVARRLYRLAFRFPREIWFLNRDDREAFLAANLLVYPERARLLHGEGIDLGHFAATPLPARADASIVFLLIGRLLWDKGVGEYVGAARKLRSRFARARFQLLGPAGAQNPSAIERAQIDAWQAEGVIEYLGETDDVRPAIGAAHCIVLPSYREGMPRSLLEAAAMTRPIVATRVPGCQDVVEHGSTGLLCRAAVEDDLAVQLARILETSPTELAAMGERGRAKALAEFDERGVIAYYFSTLAVLTGRPDFTLDAS